MKQQNQVHKNMQSLSNKAATLASKIGIQSPVGYTQNAIVSLANVQKVKSSLEKKQSLPVHVVANMQDPNMK